MNQNTELKLVATDMDGTLLDSRRMLPPGFFALLRELRRRHVRFVVSSGRQHYNLVKQFPGMADEITFISENGAMIRERDRLLYLNEISPAKLAEPVAAIRALPTARVVLCGAESAYIENGEPELIRNAGFYYERLRQVPDVLAAAHADRICKIAVYDCENIEKNVYPLLKRFRPQFAVTLSGSSWVDLMTPGTDKGGAIRFLQKLDGIGPENCIAFGDYLNDREMMANCFYSYAMANAHPLLKELCRFEAPSNDSYGVVEVLKQRFGLTAEGAL